MKEKRMHGMDNIDYSDLSQGNDLTVLHDDYPGCCLFHCQDTCSWDIDLVEVE